MSYYPFADPKPFQHQIDGVKRIVAGGGKMALLCDPGTGKSRMVIDYLGLLASNFDRPVKVLIVCPKSVKDSWLNEFDKWLGPGIGFSVEVLQGTIKQKIATLSEDTYPTEPQEGVCAARTAPNGTVVTRILNVEVLSSRRASEGPRGGKILDSDLLMKAVKKWEPDVLVCDESHRLKARSGNAARMASRISKDIPRRLLLTGTPMPHGPMDVWSQWRILDPEVFATRLPDGKIEPWPFQQFQDRYAIVGQYGEIFGYRNLDEMQERMESRSYVVHKQDCLDLPSVTYIDVPIHLSANERAAYRAMKNDLQVSLSNNSDMTAANRLAQMMRLRQISCGFVTDDDGNKSQIGTSRLDAAAELLEDIMAGESRCVVFAWSRWECDRLSERLRKNPPHGAEIHTITGDTSEAQRFSIRKGFAEGTNKQILIAQLRTISLGVNELTTACYGIFLSLSQQRDDLVQAVARLDRQGQTRPVTLYFLVAERTIDEVILQSHRDRTDLEQAVLNHLKEDR